jgi:hypothetical protein
MKFRSSSLIYREELYKLNMNIQLNQITSELVFNVSGIWYFSIQFRK